MARFFGSEGGTLGISTSGDVVASGSVHASARISAGRVTAPYGRTVAIQADAANEFVVTATDSTPFAVANPTEPGAGQRITIRIRNGSTGPLGAITWGPAYRLGAWTSPARGHSRAIDFQYDGAAWIEVSRTPVDVPN
jgi:hypothetical protein